MSTQIDGNILLGIPYGEETFSNLKNKTATIIKRTCNVNLIYYYLDKTVVNIPPDQS